ncbi:MAG: c-type cytochrome [Myxococcaceae bacterium]
MRPARLTAALLVAAALASSCAGIPLPKETLTDPSALLFNGYGKPEVTCYKCHGGDGKGTFRGANLVRVVPKSDGKQMTAALMEGKGFMPAFKDKLSAEEVAALVAWMLAAFPAPPAAPAP